MDSTVYSFVFVRSSSASTKPRSRPSGKPPQSAAMPFWQQPPPSPPPPPVIDIGVLNRTWLGGLVAVHAAIYLILRFLYGARQGPKAQSTFAAVVTYNITATCFACYTTVLGFRAWYGGEVDAIGATAQGRLYGGSETFQVLASATAVYVVYNTALTAVMPEYRTLDFVGHHFTTFLLALFGSALPTFGPRAAHRRRRLVRLGLEYASQPHLTSAQATRSSTTTASSSSASPPSRPSRSAPRSSRSASAPRSCSSPSRRPSPCSSWASARSIGRTSPSTSGPTA